MRLARAIEFSIADVEVAAFVRKCIEPARPRNVQLSNGTDRIQGRLDLAQVPPGTIFELMYDRPDPGSRYAFRLQSGERPSVRVWCEGHQTVRDVKRQLLVEWQFPSILPGGLWFSFWYCRFHQRDRFLEYGLPDLCQIDVTLRTSGGIVVRLPDSQGETFAFSERDYIEDLRWAIARIYPDIPIEKVTLFQQNFWADPSVKLADVAGEPLEVVPDARCFAFNCPASVHKVFFREGATVADARTLLARRVQIARNDIEFIQGDSLLVDDTSLYNLSEADISVTFVRPIPFIYENNRHEIMINGRMTVTAAKATVAGRLRINREKYLICLMNQQNQELDEQTTLASVESVVVVTSEKEARESSQYRIGLCLSRLPQFVRLTLNPEATLADIEPVIKSKWSIQSVEMECAVTVMATGETHRMDPSMRISEIDHHNSILFIRPAGTLYQAASALISAPRTLFGDTGKDGATLPPAEQTHMRCKVPQQGNRALSLSFPKGQTVKDARARVAAELGYHAADITVLFSGKALRDAVLLDRLKLGRLPLVVAIRAPEAVRVAAMNGPLPC
jgi:hypothetical protein